MLYLYLFLAICIYAALTPYFTLLQTNHIKLRCIPNTLQFCIDLILRCPHSAMEAARAFPRSEITAVVSQLPREDPDLVGNGWGAAQIKNVANSERCRTFLHLRTWKFQSKIRDRNPKNMPVPIQRPSSQCFLGFKPWCHDKYNLAANSWMFLPTKDAPRWSPYRSYISNQEPHGLSYFRFGQLAPTTRFLDKNKYHI